MKLFLKYLLTLFVFQLIGNPLAAETKSTSEEQVNLYLTVYNGGRALIRDQRQFSLSKPTRHIAFMDVAEKIMPQTVAIEGLDVLEQNYDFDLLSPQALINKNVGKSVRIARRSGDTGEILEWSQGLILSTNGGIILQMKDGSLESLKADTHYHLIFDQVPENLRTSPTLSLLLKQPVEGDINVEMTYLTTGLSWQSDYVLQLDKSDTEASLDSWITLNNQSGIGYQNANLQLLAGDVNLQQPRHEIAMMESDMALQARAMSAVTEQALHGYHLYTVPHKTTILNRQSKQIKLFAASSIPVQKRLQDRAYVNRQGLSKEKSKPDQYLTFKNAKPAIGLPLPKGTIRVYGKDSSGYNQFIGEDGIGHTAVNDELEIKLGKAFDISLQRSTTNFRILSKKQQLFSREIKINNGSEQQQTLSVEEIMPSQTWSIKNSTSGFEKVSPSMAKFEVLLPALTEFVISYDVVVIYQ